MSQGCRVRLALIKSSPFSGPVQKARERFGKAFAHEPHSDYQHSHTPKVLTQWLNRRKG